MYKNIGYKLSKSIIANNLQENTCLTCVLCLCSETRETLFNKQFQKFVLSLIRNFQTSILR